MNISTFISGLLLILTGVVFFLTNVGYSSWTDQQQLRKWWPVLLIILGMALFSRGKMPQWLAYVLLIAAVTAVVVYMVLIGPYNILRF